MSRRVRKLSLDESIEMSDSRERRVWVDSLIDAAPERGVDFDGANGILPGHAVKMDYVGGQL